MGEVVILESRANPREVNSIYPIKTYRKAISMASRGKNAREIERALKGKVPHTTIIEWLRAAGLVQDRSESTRGRWREAFDVDLALLLIKRTGSIPKAAQAMGLTKSQLRSRLERRGVPFSHLLRRAEQSRRPDHLPLLRRVCAARLDGATWSEIAEMGGWSRDTVAIRWTLKYCHEAGYEPELLKRGHIEKLRRAA